MYKVELYVRVRRACMVEVMSTREAARVFGLHRDTVRKMLEYSVPPGYRRQSPPRRPKLDPYHGVIDRILEEDRRLPKKQRHTAKRIYDRLRAEHVFGGKYTIVKDYVRERRLRTREMYVPLSHPAGHAQCDFGQAKAVIGGVEQTIHYFVLDLPHSDACLILSQKVCAGRIRTNVPTPGYNIQSLFRILPQHTVALRCAKSLELPQNGFLRGDHASSKPTPRRRPRRSATVTSRRSRSWAACPGASSTTTRDWRWPGSWETAGASVLACSLNSSPTTCSMTEFSVFQSTQKGTILMGGRFGCGWG